MIAWVPFFVGFNMLYFSMLVLGYMGMPRRYADHLPQYHTGHLVATIGSFIMVPGILLLIGNFIHALFRGKKAEDNPWGGVTLEWKVASPPPAENFREIPVISGKPYEFHPEAEA